MQRRINHAAFVCIEINLNVEQSFSTWDSSKGFSIYHSYIIFCFKEPCATYIIFSRENNKFPTPEQIANLYSMLT